MLHKRKSILHILLFICLFVLVGCDSGSDSFDEADVAEEDTVMADFVQTENFLDGALEHILEGELNANGQAVGFHYDGLSSKKGEIIPGTETPRNEHGIYEAEIQVDGISKTGYDGKSSFFPDDWAAQDVVDAINEAYETNQVLTGSTYEGVTSQGIVIRMYLNEQDQIISAFPVYE